MLLKPESCFGLVDSQGGGLGVVDEKHRYIEQRIGTDGGGGAAFDPIV
jgi:hypothetical protein